MADIKPSTLVQGTNIISRYLKYCLVPYGLAYKFDQAHRPKHLPLYVVLLSCMPLMFLGPAQQIVRHLIPAANKQSDEYLAIAESVFIARLASVLRLYRVMVMVSSLVIVLTQHSCISNVIASGNNYLTDKEQSRHAKTAFVFFYLTVASNTVAYSTVFMFLSKDPGAKTVLFYISLVILLSILFWTRLTNCAPLIYSCYLSYSLGKHVENFSTIYIDTMFDQFMKAIEKEGEDLDQLNQVRSLPFFDDHLDDKTRTTNGFDHNKHQNGTRAVSQSVTCGFVLWLWRVFIRILTWIYNSIRKTVIRLSMRKYPELPEMKMTKLSSTTKIQISDKTRTANNHLIRVRLRRTQIMLGDLRDLVNDINKTSSPIVLMYLIFETMFMILVTTASVQAKVYKSISILILPTISVIMSLSSCVVYICVCYDETNKQLRLLVNKLFDFIIMNHRVQSSGRQTDKLQARLQFDPERMCMLPGSEMGAINETWSQFQYTRKLANTIQFTLGGIVPVTRRLVLSILGHVLSAVFISIEIMSIIDTMNVPQGAGHTGPMSQNSTKTHNSTDITQQQHHHIPRRVLDL